MHDVKDDGRRARRQGRRVVSRRTGLALAAQRALGQAPHGSRVGLRLSLVFDGSEDMDVKDDDQVVRANVSALLRPIQEFAVGPESLSLTLDINPDHPDSMARGIAVPMDSHVKKFFDIFTQNVEDREQCREALRTRSNPKIGMYTNEFIAEFGQIFDRGNDGSIAFAVTVLQELGKKRPEYRAIIAKWLGQYKYNPVSEKLLL
ncbi:hypothetical protein THAOC_19159 [Thalassiosira oceanica]|uniref:Uncharacterized protein n=1 Tax=Thalassiosira oceanica TaxID=159749 RepID=K0S2Z8_THAOC|nr:hypothetical protein THAOC_19159 [Thalassiosira oceanica]|eukprot:EJK60483.1 hypothetical protein THAOC_19159 [Thalassiosira oceanica]